MHPVTKTQGVFTQHKPETEAVIVCVYNNFKHEIHNVLKYWGKNHKYVQLNQVLQVKNTDYFWEILFVQLYVALPNIYCTHYLLKSHLHVLYNSRLLLIFTKTCTINCIPGWTLEHLRQIDYDIWPHGFCILITSLIMSIQVNILSIQVWKHYSFYSYNITVTWRKSH